MGPYGATVRMMSFRALRQRMRSLGLMLGQERPDLECWCRRTCCTAPLARSQPRRAAAQNRDRIELKWAASHNLGSAVPFSKTPRTWQPQATAASKDWYLADAAFTPWRPSRAHPARPLPTRPAAPAAGCALLL